MSSRISAVEEDEVAMSTAVNSTERTPLNLIAVSYDNEAIKAKRRMRYRRERWFRWFIIVFASLWFISLLLVGIVQIMKARAAWGAEIRIKNGEIRQVGNISFEDYAACANNVTRLLIIRHCDKDADGSRRHCSAKGFRRAEWLPTLFIGPNARFDPPQHIIARRPEPKHYVRRSIETVQPLSKDIGIPIDTNYSSSALEPFVHKLEALIHSPHFCGSTILVCWKHEQIPKIVDRLGFRLHKGDDRRKKHSHRMKWKDSDFDTIVDLNFTRYESVQHTIDWKVDGRFTSEFFDDYERDQGYAAKEDNKDKKKKRKKSKTPSHRSR